MPRLRLNTDGLANLVHRIDVTPGFKDLIQSMSVSLNGQDEETYNRHCRPPLPGAHAAVLDFVRRAREFVPEITLTAIDGLPSVDIDACRKIADDLGVGFPPARARRGRLNLAPLAQCLPELSRGT